MSTPYHLAQGLLDHAAFLAETGDGPLAALAVAEAREIAERLGCLPVLARADALSTVEVDASSSSTYPASSIVDR